MQLVIAEKPSVAQSIAAALGVKEKKDGYIEGGGYLISWCVGHLVQLAEAAAYGEQYRKWSYDSLPKRAYAPRRRFGSRERLRRGARGRIDFPFCL